MDRHGLVCRAVLEQPDITQRELAGKLDVSLGTANGLIKECLAKGYIGENPQPGDSGGSHGDRGCCLHVRTDWLDRTSHSPHGAHDIRK